MLKVKKDRLAETILVTVAVVSLGFILYFGWLRAVLPFQIQYPEGLVLNSANLVLHGQTPYPDPRSFPYTLNCYGPLAYVLAAVAVKLFGLSLFPLRMVVLLAGLTILVLMVVLTNKMGGRWQIGLAVGVLYLCSPIVRFEFPLLRVDLWTITFSLLGLYFFLKYPHALTLHALCFAAAILIKPTSVAALSACAFELAVEHKIRRAFGLVALTTGFVVAAIVVTPGHPFFHLLRTHPDPYLISRLVALYAFAIEGSKFSLAIIIYGLAFGIKWSESSRLAWLYLGACCLTSLTAGELSSETNHFLEWTAAAGLVSSITLSNLLEVRHGLAKAFVVGLALLISIFTFLEKSVVAQTASDTSQCLAAYAYVRSFASDRILAENTSALVLSGKPVWVSDPYVTTQLKQSVPWSEGTVEDLADRQFFQLIVLGTELEEFKPESGRWSKGFIKTVGKRYKATRRFQCFPDMMVAFVPNNSPTTN